MREVEGTHVYHVIDIRRRVVATYETWTGAHRHIYKAKRRAVSRGWNTPQLSILKRRLTSV